MDHTSGAAIATANGLRFLTQLGFECRAFCGSYLDSAGEGVEEMLAKQKTPCKVEVVEVRGRQASLVHTTPGAMPVTIFRSESTRGVWRDEAEVAAFLETYQRFLDEYRPDAVWTYGGDMAADLMVKRAKDRDIPVVFGLHNFGYWDIINFAPVDYVTVPSEFSRQHHWRKLGLACHKLPNVIDWDRVQARGSHGQGSTEQGAGGCVTFVNPQPTKGLFVFARIAEVMARCRPDIPLLVVEGRSHTAWRLETGIDLGGLPNVKTMPSTGDPREFYAMTKVILMPSLWNESFGLVAAEAMINGIPVLASNRGALPETVGDGGILFDIPECYTPETRLVPTPQEVEPWVDTTIRLWDDKEFYAQATERARERAECWKPERLAPLYRDFFSNLVPQPSPPVVPKNSIDAEAEAAIGRR
jgi:glycosyltransferase involved in cell wall biosynthesis